MEDVPTYILHLSKGWKGESADDLSASMCKASYHGMRLVYAKLNFQDLAITRLSCVQLLAVELEIVPTLTSDGIHPMAVEMHNIRLG